MAEVCTKLLNMVSSAAVPPGFNVSVCAVPLGPAGRDQNGVIVEGSEQLMLHADPR